MAFNVEWTRTATLDLEAIVNYIAEEAIETASYIMSRLEEAASALVRLHRRGSIVPELADCGIHTYQELAVRPGGLSIVSQGKK